MAKTICKLNTQKRIEAEKNGDKDGKALYKLMNNAVYGKKLKNVRNSIDVNFVNSEKGYLNWTSKPSYMSQKIFDNDLIAIQKSNVTLTLNKLSDVGMYILDFSV